jgi:hypothetical protein
MNKNTTILVAVVLIIIAAAGGFFGGLQYAKSQARTPTANGFGTGNGQSFRRFGQTGQNANFGAVRGQVISMGNNTLTVKLTDGSTKIVVLSSSTTFAQSTKAALTDLKVGDTVSTVGTTNSDGSVTAQDVQINPTQPMRPQGNGQQAPASPTNGSGY